MVMVEDDAGNFVRAPRWHDAAAPGTAAEHTLGVIMTHGDGGADTEGGLRVRACRGYAAPYTLNPKPLALNPKPLTLKPKP